MWIKICGTTTLEDAQLAASVGADALGFIFAPSKRQVSPEQVAAIIKHLSPGIEPVGVFQGHTADEVVKTVERTGLKGVQIHGTSPGLPKDGEEDRERPDAGANLFGLAQQLSRAFGGRVRLIQTLHWPVNMTHEQEATLREQISALADLPAIDRVLIDSRVGVASGGTGVAFDWEQARPALSAIPSSCRTIVAGGLNPENVAEAIRVLQPWGVDVVTGVEAAPGIKDAKKLAAFIERARA